MLALSNSFFKKEKIDNSSMLLYSVYRKGRFALERGFMNIIVNMSSMVPIYEQIMEAVKQQIAAGTLRDGDALPSVRSLAKDLRISALTVKKAYDALEAEGFILTVHGKGSYVHAAGGELLREEQLKRIEAELDQIVRQARLSGVTADELQSMFEIIQGEHYA